MAGSIPFPQPFLAVPGEPSVPFEEWIESFEFYVSARGGEISGNQKLALLMCCLGAEGQAQYRAIRNDPVPPENGMHTVYDQAVIRLTNRFADRSGVMTARMKFRQRQQMTDESIVEFVVALQKLVTRCKFGSYSASEAVKKQLIMGAAAERVRESLLLLDDSTALEQTVRAAARTEQSLREAKHLGAPSVSAISSQKAKTSNVRKPPCRNCKFPQHAATEQCPARGVECHRCRKVGHFARACMTAGNRSNPEWMVNNVNTAPAAENKTEDEFCLYVAPVTLCQELQSVVSVSGSPIRFLVDTGAAVSIVCVNQVSPCLGELQPSSLRLKTYNETSKF